MSVCKEKAMRRKSRPKVVPCKVYRYKTSCGHLYLRFGYDKDEQLLEMFANLGKSGNCIYGHLEVISRLISDILKLPLSFEDKKHAITHLCGINCGNGFIEEGERYSSCLDLIGRVALKELEESQKKIKNKPEEIKSRTFSDTGGDFLGKPNAKDMGDY